MPAEGVIASYDREIFVCVKGIKSFGNSSGLGEGLTIHTTKYQRLITPCRRVWFPGAPEL
jgi:hypothetical protein